MAAVLLPRLQEALGAVGPVVEHAEVVVDVAVLRVGAHLAAAHRGGVGRRAVLLGPEDLVHRMDRLLDQVVAAEGRVVVPVAELILHVGPLRLALLVPELAGEVGRVHVERVADVPGEDAVVDRAVAEGGAPAEAAGEAQPLLLHLVGRGQHRARTRRVDRDRLLGEDMAAALHRRGQVLRTEHRGRGEQHHVAGVDDVLVGVEADEPALLGDVDLIGEVPAEAGVAGVEAVAEEVAHRPQHHAGVGADGVHRGTGAAAAAANQADLELVAAAGEGTAADHRQRGHAGAGGLQETTPGHAGGGVSGRGLRHGSFGSGVGDDADAGEAGVGHPPGALRPLRIACLPV